MKVYLVGEHYEYEGDEVNRAFTDETQAIIDACLNDEEVLDVVEVDEIQYDVNKYPLYYFWNISYNPYQKDPIINIYKKYGIEGINKYDEEDDEGYEYNKVHISSSNPDCRHAEYVYRVKCDTKEEAREIFYNALKECMDQFYINNQIVKQNGKIKTWKFPKKK